MQFAKLRLVGFKSFVEATDFEIRPGLTGIVGPNGCGKSNLVEALRWVMGETSYKSMRASGMDDVIFAGGGTRPSRNSAEVALTLDNSARTAPAAFNDADELEVTRRIERESGSTYRINGREVRARDIQILFADASTGARSPALVRQGQISEIISAKPQARRRILEEAAGVAGLHTRRHEAELRLKAAEDNLARVDDVLSQIAGQGESLRRQARQAQRYRELQADIRRGQALVALLGWEAAQADIAAADAALHASERAVVESTRAQGEAARHQAVAAHAMPALRDSEVQAGAKLQDILVARQMLDGEERRTKNRRLETERRITEMEADLARDDATVADAAAALARLDAEHADLAGRVNQGEDESEARRALLDLEKQRAEAEAILATAQAACAEADARRRALAERARDDLSRRDQAERALADAARARQALQLSIGDDAALAETARALESAAAALTDAETRMRGAEQNLAAARENEAARRAPLAQADRDLQRLQTEAKVLGKLVQPSGGAGWASVLDSVTVARGFEQALGAALGDDLEASVDPRAPAFWTDSGGTQLPALPEGAEPLAKHVEAPAPLRRRLAMIGLVDRARGSELQMRLAPGQRLVSRDGDLWRWDGFTRTAKAPTAAARRLAERNRLAEVEEAAAQARTVFLAAKDDADSAQSDLRKATAHDAQLRAQLVQLRAGLERARSAHAALERRSAESGAKLAALVAAEEAKRQSRDLAAQQAATSQVALDELPSGSDLPARRDTARAELARLRAAETDARAGLAARERERDLRARRLTAVLTERESWTTRSAQAGLHRGDLAVRLAAAVRERTELAEAPDRFVLRRRQIQADADLADRVLATAREVRSAGELALAEADRHARAALDDMAKAREGKVRDETRAAAARQHAESLARTIASELDCDPAGLQAVAGLRAGDARPDPAQMAVKLDLLKADRERLGAVNLRAEEELAAIDLQRSGLDKEKADLAEAISRLRKAIGSLNREGRERLLAAFTKVNGFFAELFTDLFGGGTAELQLIESDDPLEAGLEIVARPPGKRLQVMSLLSGGEQALTAISLIFAVFLSNPAPICVLDEVDAPLDDANVERFCHLVDGMRRRTQTRFITITHNPLTMARMDRLYGVTQVERGISQLVSVELAQAERLLEAS